MRNKQKQFVAIWNIFQLIGWGGTVALMILGIVVAAKSDFSQNTYYELYKQAVDKFIWYSTITPLLEAIVNANDNQLTSQKEVKIK